MHPGAFRPDGRQQEPSLTFRADARQLLAVLLVTMIMELDGRRGTTTMRAPRPKTSVIPAVSTAARKARYETRIPCSTPNSAAASTSS
mgnify:CR=1 FL=1